ITRAAPARILGLSRKGHLGPGADADITIYTPQADFEQMFQLPRCVIKAGEIIVDQGEIRQSVSGVTLNGAPDFDRDAVPLIREWFESCYTVQFRNYHIEDYEVGSISTEPCGNREALSAE